MDYKTYMKSRNHKNKIISKLCFVIGIIFIVIVVRFLRTSPLENLDFADCSIGVYTYYWGDGLLTLNDEETKAFVEMLTSAQIGKNVGDAYKDYLKTVVGYSGPDFQVVLKDGTSMDISILGYSYLVINDCGYDCDPDSLGELNMLQTKILEERY